MNRTKTALIKIAVIFCIIAEALAAVLLFTMSGILGMACDSGCSGYEGTIVSLAIYGFMFLLPFTLTILALTQIRWLMGLPIPKRLHNFVALLMLVAVGVPVGLLMISEIM